MRGARSHAYKRHEISYKVTKAPKREIYQVKFTVPVSCQHSQSIGTYCARRVSCCWWFVPPPHTAVDQPDPQIPLREGRARSAEVLRPWPAVGYLTETANRGVPLQEALQRSQHRVDGAGSELLQQPGTQAGQSRAGDRLITFWPFRSLVSIVRRCWKNRLSFRRHRRRSSASRQETRHTPAASRKIPFSLEKLLELPAQLAQLALRRAVV